MKLLQTIWLPWQRLMSDRDRDRGFFWEGNVDGQILMEGLWRWEWNIQWERVLYSDHIQRMPVELQVPWLVYWRWPAAWETIKLCTLYCRYTKCPMLLLLCNISSKPYWLYSHTFLKAVFSVDCCIDFFDTRHCDYISHLKPFQNEIWESFYVPPLWSGQHLE